MCVGMCTMHVCPHTHTESHAWSRTQPLLLGGAGLCGLLGDPGPRRADQAAAAGVPPQMDRAVTHCLPPRVPPIVGLPQSSSHSLSPTVRGAGAVCHCCQPQRHRCHPHCHRCQPQCRPSVSHSATPVSHSATSVSHSATHSLQ